MGAFLSGLFALYVLNCTIQKNRKENETFRSHNCEQQLRRDIDIHNKLETMILEEVRILFIYCASLLSN